jgi:hypothetical protein
VFTIKGDLRSEGIAAAQLPEPIDRGLFDGGFGELISHSIIHKLGLQFPVLSEKPYESGRVFDQF